MANTKTVDIEGFRVTLTFDEGMVIASCPELPGCCVQGKDETEAKREFKKAAGIYLAEMAKGPAMKPKRKKEKDGQQGGPPPKKIPLPRPPRR